MNRRPREHDARNRETDQQAFAAAAMASVDQDEANRNEA
jgi:hypothetical protein